MHIITVADDASGWCCDLCGDDDGCKMSKVVACLRHRPSGMCLSLKSKLRRCGATLRQRCRAMGRSDSVGARHAPFLMRGSSSKSELPRPRRVRSIVWPRPAGFRVPFVRRGLDGSSAAKSESPARGEVMTMTLQAASTVSSPRRCA